MYPHTKFGIPIANYIGDMPEVKFKVTTTSHPQSKFRIPTLKQYKIYALDTIFLEPVSEDK